MTEIKVNNLGITLGGRKVLSDINLTLDAGKSCVVLGGSGCGKSVLMKSIIGLLVPDKASEVTINNIKYTTQSITERKDLVEQFGMLFQGGALFDSLKIWENIAFRPKYHDKISTEVAKELAAAKLKQVGLDSDVMFKYPKELSGGMQKRAALARTIAHDPKIIFFDEPTTGLDPINAVKIAHLIRELSDKIQATTLTITHDMPAARIIADKAAMLRDGSLIWQGNDIDKAGDDYVRRFINPI